MSDVLLKRMFIASAMFLLGTFAFASGLAVGRWQLWPYQPIQAAWFAAKSYAAHGELVPEGRRVPAPRGAPRERITIHDRSRVDAGYYVFVGWNGDGGGYAAWLYDHAGKRRHTWPIDYAALDADGPSNGADNPHAFHVLPDGSVIAAFDKGDVMARLDACGEPLWIKPGIYHHAMSRADDGTFWVWRGDGTAYGHYNYLHRFDPRDGATLGEIDLVEDVIRKMGESAVVFGVRPDYPFRRFDADPEDQAATDLFHPNDVDVLTEALAPRFPMFEAGDLLLSFRTIDLVAVLDPDEHRVKWWSHGPWIGQHDPDFGADGRISVYNNNTNRDRTEIIKIDPKTREISNELFHGDAFFRSDFMGKHQYLPSGNVLVVVPGEGRVLEVTAGGSKVMEFNNVAAGAPAWNDHVENGMWFPQDYFATLPECSA